MCAQAACICFEGSMRTKETPNASVREGDLAIETGSPELGRQTVYPLLCRKLADLAVTLPGLETLVHREIV